MYQNFYMYLIFIPIIILSNIFSIYMNSWFSMWMLMEINLTSLMILLIFDLKSKNEMIILYFMFQTFNSYLFLFGSIMLSYFKIFEIIMFMALFNKLGMPPFHYWYIKVFQNLSWNNIMILSTIQKIIPLMIINMMINLWNSEFINMIIMLNMIFMTFNSIKAMNMNSIKLIMGYSSMIQMNWVFLILLINEKIMFIYLFIYSIIQISMIMIFKYLNINEISNLSILKFKKQIFLIFLINSFSLSSIPPFMGFSMKWISILMFQMNFNIIIILIIIINSVISMIFYFRFILFSIMYNFLSIKKNYKIINFVNLNNNILILLNLISIFFLFSLEMF